MKYPPRDWLATARWDAGRACDWLGFALSSLSYTGELDIGWDDFVASRALRQALRSLQHHERDQKRSQT